MPANPRISLQPQLLQKVPKKKEEPDNDKIERQLKKKGKKAKSKKSKPVQRKISIGKKNKLE